MGFLEKNAIRFIESLKRRISPVKEEQPSNSFYLGTAQSLYDRNKDERIYLSPPEKENHMYLVGATCTGKSTFLEHMIRQHILASEGFALFDVHGDLSEQIKRFLASRFKNKDDKGKEEFAKRLILIEPFNIERIASFNPLDVQNREKIYFTVLELVEIFKNRWEDFWGPRTDELMRNMFLILAESGLTLLEVPAILLNSRFRKSLAPNIKNEEAQNWLYRYNKLTEPQKTIYRDPSLNKITEFLGDVSTRYLLGQEKSRLDFRDALDQGKWVIFNIPKGHLKSNAFLLAGLFLCKLQLAALSRTDIPYSQRTPFYIFADEFQSLATKEVSSMEIILSESRKYKVFLRMAHQNISQIEKRLTQAILGNAKIITSFRVNHNDARILSPEINPGTKESLTKKLSDLETGKAYFKMRGKPHRLLKLPMPKEITVEEETVEEMKKLSFSYYTKPFKEIESEIEARHKRLGLTRQNSNESVNSSEEEDEW